MVELILFGVIAIVALCAYFLPALIAATNGHRYPNAVFALNLLLGWTFLGWVAALVWALMKPPDRNG